MVVDAHTHILPAIFREQTQRFLSSDRTFGELFGGAGSPRTVSAPQLLRAMDASEVDMAVVAGYGWTDKQTAKLANDYILESSQRYPRLIPFCSLNPLWGDEAVVDLHRLAKAGARGVGELHPDTQGLLAADIGLLNNFMAAAEELKLPLLIHASEPVGHRYAGKGTATPALLVELVRAFPGNRFIFAHIGGGLPFYALMPEVKRMLANVWFDSAACPLLYRPEVLKVAAAACGTNKLLFASDYPLVSLKRALREFDASGLGVWHKKRIGDTNLRQLLNL